MSSLSDKMKRTSEVLKQGASTQVLDYEQRFSSIKTLYDDLLSDFIRMQFEGKNAHETVKEFFGTSSVRFAGVDGTMYSRPLFDLIIFFGGAYASTGTITFQGEGTPQVKYDTKTLEEAAGISSVVPIYVNEVPEVDQAFFETDGSGEIDPNKPFTDESIINNATIANWIMTFAEYYLAYKLVTDPDQEIRILLLDRSLSIERASLIYDTSKRELWKTRSSLIGYQIGDNEPFDVNDFTIARQCICNEALGLPPPRGDYLGHAITQLVKKNGPLTEKQILSLLKIEDEKRARRTIRQIKRSLDAKILTEKNETFSLNPRYSDVLERIEKLVTTLGDQFFFTNTSAHKTSSVMRIQKNSKEHWLTTIDIAFLTLFTLQMLLKECWQKHILLIGMTKDTAARDFKRQLIPILHDQRLLKAAVSRLDFDRLPNTDRMILQSTSILNPEKIEPPWSLIEYDSAFRTMVPDAGKRMNFVSGAIKNRVGLEKIFVKTYVQLAQAKTDPILRSNVLLIDRLVYPEYDFKIESTAEFWNEFGGANEPLQVILFRDKNVPNKLQDVVMTTLIAMAPSNVPEAFGHNKPLFVADKIAKWNFSQFKLIVDTTANWILNNHKLRKFIFYMSTFRERRASIEAARRE